MTARRWLSTREAAARLNVQPATLYAYVSRGLLRSHPSPEGRGSRFHVDDVERLAARGRPGRRGRQARRRPELVVYSAITEVTDGSVRYRGRDAVELAGRVRFEQVAELLVTGRLGSAATWASDPSAVRAARAAQPPLASEATPLQRLTAAAAAAATVDPLRADRRAPAVWRAARTLLGAMVDALPAGARDGEPGPRPLAARLWAGLCHHEPGLVDVLDAALVLLADHDLAPSTLAARVGAAAGADPAAVVLAGLATVSGARHGGVTRDVEELLATIRSPGQAPEAIAAATDDRGRLPGFGQPQHPSGDPRGARLLALLQPAAADHPRWPVVETVWRTATLRDLPPPSVDFALGALTHLSGMPVGAAEAVFAVARSAGWVAHALEQYDEEALIRPQAVYVGPDALASPTGPDAPSPR